MLKKQGNVTVTSLYCLYISQTITESSPAFTVPSWQLRPALHKNIIISLKNWNSDSPGHAIRSLSFRIQVVTSRTQVIRCVWCCGVQGQSIGSLAPISDGSCIMLNWSAGYATGTYYIDCRWDLSHWLLSMTVDNSSKNKSLITINNDQ